MGFVEVHPRIKKRHPDLAEQDVLDAWESCFRSVPRLDRVPHEYIAVGADRKGRLIEMVVLRSSSKSWLVYHAMTPPSKKTLTELGFADGRSRW